MQGGMIMYTEATPTERAATIQSTPLTFDIPLDQLADEITGTVWEDLFDTVDVFLSKEQLYPVVREAVVTALQQHLTE